MRKIKGLGVVTIALTNFSINWMNVRFTILYIWFVVQLGFWEPNCAQVMFIRLCIFFQLNGMNCCANWERLAELGV